MAYADGNIVIGTSVDVGGLNTGLKRIEKSIKRINGLAVGLLGAKALVSLSKAAINAASDLQEVQNIVDTTFGDMAWKAEKFADVAIEKFGMSELAAKQTAGSFAAMGKAMGLSLEDATNMAVKLAAQTGDFASFLNLSQEYARVALSAVYTGETETMKRYGIILTEANLQEYAATKGITKKVKAMAAEEKLMLRYSYIQDVLNDKTSIGMGITGDFEKTQKSWANQTRLLTEHWKEFLIVLGNGLTTVGAPLLSWLNSVVVRLTQFSKVVGSILSQLMGLVGKKGASLPSASSGFDDVAGSASDAADATNKAAKAAKKALGPFDELNNITTKSDSGDGGGGGFGDMNIDVPWDEWEKAAEENPLELPNNWFDFGKWLRDGFIDALESINWQEIQTKAKVWASRIAEIINGFFTPDELGRTSLGVLGKTIAEFLNTAVDFMLTFATSLQWEKIGYAIADGINNFFETFDFAELAQTINAWVQGLWTMMSEAIKNVDWGTVFKGIFEFVSNLDFSTIAILLLPWFVKGIGKLLGSGKSLIGKAIGSVIRNALIDYFTGGAGGAGLAEAFSTWITTNLGGGSFIAGLGTLFAGIASIVAGVTMAIVGFIDAITTGVDWVNTLLTVIGTTLAAIGAALLGLITWPAVLVAAIVAAFTMLIVWIVQNWETVKQFFVDLWEGIKNVFSKAVEAIKGFWNGLVEKIKGVWNGIAEWFRSKVIEPIVQFFEPFTRRISQLVEGCWILIKAIIMIVANFVNTYIIQPVINAITTLVNTIKTVLSTLWNGIKTAFTTVAGIFTQYIVTPIVNAVTTVWNTAKNILTMAFNWIRSTFIEPIKNLFVQMANFLSQLFTRIANGIVSVIKSIVNGVISLVEGVINRVISVVNIFLGGFNKIVSKAATITGSSWGGVDLIPNVSVPRLAKGGVIPPNAPFMAMLGDQKSGTNIEAPLDTIKQALAEVMASTGGTTDNSDIVINIDGNEIFRVVRKQSQMFTKSTGVPAF